MITNRGKEIIARYLAGQTPAAFSHIAIGVGPRPKSTPHEFQEYASKKHLDFEALRVPITTASILQESGKTKIVFSGTLPTDRRYEITEIGIFPTESNSLLTTAQDVLMFTVIDQENWTESGGSDIPYTTLIPGLNIVPLYESPDLAKDLADNTSYTLNTYVVGAIYEVIPRKTSDTLDEITLDGTTVIAAVNNKATFRATSNSHAVENTSAAPANISIRRATSAVFVKAIDPVLLTTDRMLHRSRVGDDALLIRGDYSELTGSPYVNGVNGYTVGGSYVYVDNFVSNFSKARGDDELKVGVSIVPAVYENIVGSLTPDPDKPALRLCVEFSHDTEYARAEWLINADTTSEILPTDVDFVTNQYYVVTKKINSFSYSANFQWSKASVIKAYAQIDGNGANTADQYWLSLDALRFDSNNDNNPIYGLVAYSVVSNPQESPMPKNAGLESQIEYKISMDSD